MWTVSAPSPSPTRSGHVPTCPLHGVPFGGPGWPEHLSPSVRGPRAGLPSPPGRRERGVQWAAVRGTVLLVRLWPRPAVHPPEAQRPAGLSSGRWPGGQRHPLRKDGGSPAGDSSPTCPAVGLGQGRGPPGGRGPGRPQGGPEGPCPAARTVPLPTPRQLSQAAGHGRGACWGLVRKSASSLS